MPPAPTLRASCACGAVAVEARGRPIITAVCYCDDCQAAGRAIEARPGAPRVLDPDGGTAVVLFRKDRLDCIRGKALLEPVKLRAASPTSRHVASCCNSAVYAGFDDAKHWVDVYRARVEGTAPPIEARICTRFRPPGPGLPADAPAYARYPFRLIARLLAARAAMLFGR